MRGERVRSRVFSEQKRWLYLERARTMRLASLGADGAIRLSPRWFVVDEERVFVEIDQDSHLEDLADDARVTALVDGGEEFATRHGLSFTATSRRVTDRDEHGHIAARVQEKYFFAEHPYLEAHLEYGIWTRRRYVELIPDAWTAWDFRETSQPQGRELRRFPRSLHDRFYSSEWTGSAP
jgi:hypothetical protein